MIFSVEDDTNRDLLSLEMDDGVVSIDCLFVCLLLLLLFFAHTPKCTEIEASIWVLKLSYQFVDFESAQLPKNLHYLICAESLLQCKLLHKKNFTVLCLSLR